MNSDKPKLAGYMSLASIGVLLIAPSLLGYHIISFPLEILAFVLHNPTDYLILFLGLYFTINLYLGIRHIEKLDKTREPLNESSTSENESQSVFNGNDDFLTIDRSKELEDRKEVLISNHDKASTENSAAAVGVENSSANHANQQASTIQEPVDQTPKPSNAVADKDLAAVVQKKERTPEMIAKEEAMIQRQKVIEAQETLNVMDSFVNQMLIPEPENKSAIEEVGTENRAEKMARELDFLDSLKKNSREIIEEDDEETTDPRRADVDPDVMEKLTAMLDNYIPKETSEEVVKDVVIQEDKEAQKNARRDLMKKNNINFDN